MRDVVCVYDKLSNRDVGMLHDMINMVWKDIRNPLLEIELSVSFLLSLNLT